MFPFLRTFHIFVVSCCISYHFSTVSLFLWFSIFVSIICILKSYKMLLSKMNKIFIWEDEKRISVCFYGLHWYNIRVLWSRKELSPLFIDGNSGKKRLSSESRLCTLTSCLMNTFNSWWPHHKGFESKSTASRPPAYCWVGSALLKASKVRSAQLWAKYS